MHLSETELFLRANKCQANLSTQVIIKLLKDPGLFIVDPEHLRGIDTNYVVPIRGVILDEKTPKLKYGGLISVDKWEELDKAIFN